MKRTIAVFLSLFMLVALVSCGGGKQVKTTKKNQVKNKGTATGYATIFDNDTALARDRAIGDAKIKLVRKVMGETLSGTSVMKDFELVSNIVKARSMGLVKHDRITKQWQAGTEYFVTIEGIVEPAAVEDAIASILNTYGKPKFMVLIQETFDRRRSTPGFTQTELIIQELMGNSGFEFVDASMTQELMKRDRRRMNKAIRGQVSNDVQELLLNDAGAEVIIIGTARTNDQSNVLRAYGAANMKSKAAIVSLKAIDVYTGRILASITRNAPGIHIDSTTASKNAVGAALKKILGKNNEMTGKFEMGPFMRTITGKFVKAANNRQINLLVTGLDYNGLRKFRNNVSQRIRGVQSVNPKGQLGRAARLEVYFAGKTSEFTDELMAKAGNMGFSIKVKESYPNKLVLLVNQNK